MSQTTIDIRNNLIQFMSKYKNIKKSVYSKVLGVKYYQFNTFLNGQKAKNVSNIIEPYLTKPNLFIYELVRETLIGLNTKIGNANMLNYITNSLNLELSELKLFLNGEINPTITTKIYKLFPINVNQLSKQINRVVHKKEMLLNRHCRGEQIDKIIIQLDGLLSEYKIGIAEFSKITGVHKKKLLSFYKRINPYSKEVKKFKQAISNFPIRYRQTKIQVNMLIEYYESTRLKINEILDGIEITRSELSKIVNITASDLTNLLNKSFKSVNYYVLRPNLLNRLVSKLDSEGIYKFDNLKEIIKRCNQLALITKKPSLINIFYEE